MEDFKNVTIWQLLKLLQEKVQDNAVKIKDNIKEVEELKKTKGIKEKETVIEELYKKNYDLTRENTSMLEFHNSLYKFYSEFKTIFKDQNFTVSMERHNDLSWNDYRENCLRRSVSGELKLDKHHPFIKDREFLDELLNRCTAAENYERCLEIQAIKDKAKA